MRNMPSFVLSRQLSRGISLVSNARVGKSAAQHIPDAKEARLPAAGLELLRCKREGETWVSSRPPADGSKAAYTLFIGYPELHLNFRGANMPRGTCGEREAPGTWVSPGLGTSPFGSPSVPWSLGFCVCQMGRITGWLGENRDEMLLVKAISQCSANRAFPAERTGLDVT